MFMTNYMTNSCTVCAIPHSGLQHFSHFVFSSTEVFMLVHILIFSGFQRPSSSLPEVRRFSACAERDNILHVHSASVQHLSQIIPHQFDSKTQLSGTAY